MKYISLFAGIGGFDLALNRLGHECVYVNEWDKYATQIYEKNFCRSADRSANRAGKSDTQGDAEKRQRLESSERKKTGDEKRSFGKYGNRNAGNGAFCCVDTRSITDVPASAIPRHDLLVGGFPCQAFSIAGKRRGFEETRGTLFFDIARILSHHRTKYFILENVKGLTNHDNGRTFKFIIKTLAELGYDLQWQVLNSKDFGVPQNRERVFIVGHLRGERRPEIFPIIRNSENACEIVGRLTGINGHDYLKRVYSVNGVSPTIPTGTGGNHEGKFLVDNPLQGMRIRRLTPIECERLQGFPDGWTEGVSDTQRYKMLGNAVTVNVVEYIVNSFFLPYGIKN